MPSNLLVALIQMNSQDSVTANLDAVEKMTADAKALGAELIALPEYFYSMGNPAAFSQIAESEGQGPIQNRLKALAITHSVHILAGSLPLRNDHAKQPDARISSGSILFSPQGAVTARYDKRHLFDQILPGERHGESDYFEAGSRIITADVGGAKLGFAICYDLRFPEHFRSLLEQGAEILCVPAAFTQTTGEAHWHVLLRARAIENLCYVIAPAQVGTHVGNKRTFGHSMIIDPWGGIVAEATSNAAEIILGNLDLDKLREKRKAFPVLSHRRSKA